MRLRSWFKIRVVASFLSFFLLFVAMIPSVFAVTYRLQPSAADVLQDQPAKFHYVVSPGEKIQDVLLVERKSTSDEPDTARVNYFAVDGGMTSNGFLSLESERGEQTEVGSWIDLHKDSEIVGDSAAVPFTLHVPRNATPGQYIGGFVLIEDEKGKIFDYIQAAAPNTSRSFSKIRMRYATTVLVDVPGEVTPSYRVENVSYEVKEGVLNVEFDFINNGNVAYDLGGYVQLDGLLKNEIKDLSYRKILPGKKIRIRQIYDDLRPFLGRFNVNLHLNLATNFNGKQKIEIFDDYKNIWFFSLGFVVALVFVFLIIYVIINRLLLRVMTLRWVPYTVSEGDTIQVISNKFHVNWKLLIRRNNLKAPYLLIERQVLLVPPLKYEDYQKEKQLQSMDESKGDEIPPPSA